MGVDMSTEITLQKELKTFLQNFRANRFASSKEVTQISNENGIPPEFKRTRKSKEKSLHNYEEKNSRSQSKILSKLLSVHLGSGNPVN
jgi:hypothetical protein